MRTAVIETKEYIIKILSDGVPRTLGDLCRDAPASAYSVKLAVAAMVRSREVLRGGEYRTIPCVNTAGRACRASHQRTVYRLNTSEQ